MKPQRPCRRLQHRRPALTSAVATLALLLLTFSATNTATARSDWPLEFWQDFIDAAAARGLPEAFGSDRFPLLRTLVEIGESKAGHAEPLKDWLTLQMRQQFHTGNRTKAYVFKGFFTCIDDGNCRHLHQLDSQANVDAEPFEPDLTVIWAGTGQPAGSIDWLRGRFADLGRIRLIDSGWDPALGVYAINMTRTARPRRANLPPRTFEIKIDFYSPCSFTGVEERNFGQVAIGGVCPDNPCVSSSSCLN